MTSVPFDDIDAIDKHGFVIGKCQSKLFFPSAVMFKPGEPELLDVSILIWLVRALLAQIELLGSTR